MNKFKVGDLVKKDNSNYFVKSFIYNDFYNRYLYSIWHNTEMWSYVAEQELELVSTSEELAVEKFKEELREKINKIDNLFSLTYSKFYDKDAQIKGAEKMKKKILEMLK